MDKINSAFHKTLQRYGITNVWLSQESGVNDKMISRFRNGKTTIQTDTLQKLLDALPHEARSYYFSQLMGSSFVPNLELLAENLSSDDLHNLFDLLADRVLKRSRAAKLQDELSCVA